MYGYMQKTNSVMGLPRIKSMALWKFYCYARANMHGDKYTSCDHLSLIIYLG